MVTHMYGHLKQSGCREMIKVQVTGLSPSELDR